MRRDSLRRLRPALPAAAAAMAALAITASPASAQEPACAGYKDVANHGEHVISDYVLGAVVGGEEVEAWPPSGGIGDVVGPQGGAALPGGPGPAYHFQVGAPPGASFCVP
ncbi:MAG TPA: hypothetical protein VK964_17780 [Nocardioidaceae bacterium]|nr:hypothetical protein [Nocardioidaceae bacterium]